jgi:hypothetical protein
VPTPKEFRANITENRAELHAALHGAHQKWEQSPLSGEGEESWAPKKVAEHAIGAEWFFTNAISQACGAPALERPSIDVSTPAAAAASLSRMGVTCDNILRHVSDTDLAKKFEVGNLGSRGVEEMLTIMDSHARDHINQLRTASS